MPEADSEQIDKQQPYYATHQRVQQPRLGVLTHGVKIGVGNGDDGNDGPYLLRVVKIVQREPHYHAADEDTQRERDFFASDGEVTHRTNVASFLRNWYKFYTD